MFFGTTYYWRACAKSVNDTSEWSTTFNFTTKNTVICASPSNGAINRDIFITINWSGIFGNNGYMYQLDTTPSFSSPLFLQENTAANSSEAGVSELFFGTTYYWRACAKSVNDTSDWSTTFNFTTKSTVTNVSPSNGSTNQHLLLNLDWSGIFGNNGYMYQLDTTPSFNSPIFVQTNTPMDNSNSDINLYYFGTTYYWRACAKSVNDTSEWSSTFNFTTKNTVTNTSPSNNSVNIPIDVNLDWSFINNNDGYLCQIDTSFNFNSAVFQQLTSATSSSEIDVNGLLYGTKYYWRAACKSTMDTSEFSTTWNFKTVYELTETPTLITPANLSTDISYNSVGLEWTSITGATSYQYEYSTDNTFATGVNSATTSLITGTISGLYPNTIYFWRVRGGNGAGFSPWSDVWQFTTEGIIFPEPILIAPLNNSTGIDFNTVTLEWNPVWGASEYIYEISADNTFASGVTCETITATNKTLVGLAEDTQYFWRVKASDGSTEGNWSVVWNFTTEGVTIPEPTLISPLNNSTDIDFNTVTLEWNSAEGATEYTYEISADNTFASGVTSETITATNKTLVGLAEDTQYFWRVKASDGSTEGNWSVVWNFTTEGVTIPEPTLISPLNNSTDIDFNTVTLEWNSAEGATEYTYEISADNTFTSGVTSETITATNKTLTDLAEDTQYFWRVKASDGATESNWSVVWNFTTDNTIGISNIETSIQVYPNPTTGLFSVKGTDINSIEIINSKGQIIKSKIIDNNFTIINLTNVPDGLYIMKLINNKEIIYKKVIKR